MDTSIMEELHAKGFSFEQIMIVVEIINRFEAGRRAVGTERTRAWRARQNEPMPEQETMDGMLVPTKPARKKPSLSYLAPDTEPTDAQIAYAVGFGPGMSREAALETFSRFRDYWVGHGRPMADWLATWQTWVRKVKPEERREIEQSVRPKTGKPTDHLTGAGRSNGFGGFVAYGLAHAEQLSAEDAKKRELETCPKLVSSIVAMPPKP